MGISAAKSRIARTIGVPLTRSGRQPKLGSRLIGRGGLVVSGLGLAVPVVVTRIAAKLI